MFIHSRTFRLPVDARACDRNRRSISTRPMPSRLGIAQDDPVRLSTPEGSITVAANLTEIAQPGVVHMYHGYAQANVNDLMPPDYLDPISGFPGFKGLLCAVEKVVS